MANSIIENKNVVSQVVNKYGATRTWSPMSKYNESWSTTFTFNMNIGNQVLLQVNHATLYGLWMAGNTGSEQLNTQKLFGDLNVTFTRNGNQITATCNYQSAWKLYY